MFKKIAFVLLSLSLILAACAPAVTPEAMMDKPTESMMDKPTEEMMAHESATPEAMMSDATVTLYRAGTKENVAGGRSYNQEKSNPIKFKVLPGIYDVEIGSVELANKPKMRWEKQNLGGGATISLSHNFESGILKIGAKQGEAFVDAVVTVYSKKTGESVVGGRTYMSESSNPKSFTLEPGKYKVDLKPVKPKDLSPRTLEVEVKAKETTERLEKW